MNRIFLILFMFLGTLYLNAQDVLYPLNSNPSLFKNQSQTQELSKQLVAEDSIVYNYDTLGLPFLDDFSTDHLPIRVSDLTASNIRDTLFYKFLIGSTIYRDSLGFSLDTTFKYVINNTGDTVSHSPNAFIFVTLFNLEVYPPTSEPIEVYPPYTIFDTIGLNRPDTIRVKGDLLQDSAFYYLVDPNPNDWYINRDVLVNETFPLNPPTIGVATFDGLNQYGLPYSPDFAIRVKADELTSVPLDLTNPSAIDEVYFSFYYQPKGRSLNQPEAQDSLALDFYNPTTKTWKYIWGVGGFSSDTFSFKMIQVDPTFHKKGFQFRFRAYAQGSGAYDHWNVDYIYLNDNRTVSDTTFRDISFIYPVPSLLKDYTVMPWWHFKSNPALYGLDQTTNLIRNQFNQGLNIYYKFVMVDSLSANPFYIFPGANVFDILGARDTFSRTFNINYTYISDSVKGPGKFESRYDISFRPGTGQPKDLIPSNDTLRTGICLDNYYAYDDGSAETGYGINPVLSTDGYISFMAVQFQIPFEDTLGGVQIYFLPQFPDITNQKFELYVWDNLSTGGVRFTSPKKITPLYTDDNGFVTYWFDTNIVVNQTFYVGIRSIGEFSMSLGYDLNTKHKNKIFYSYNGSNWNSPSSGIFEGSLMLRPVFRKKNWGVGIDALNIDKVQIDLFPNPAKDILNIQFDQELKNASYQVFSIGGQLMQRGRLSNSIQVSNLSNGVYFIRIETEKGYHINKKFVIAK